ncbi:hypothetical protein Vau01_079610 [Virgisporangium aurantiacum]|uniref:MAM domain-containing protein n=1 Tax=Virgisporangium aurantiacum TaxID=175570 RepID=A0A8J4E329_9ACTN|nr:hypothetical protein Vau01_079610 [Virgisporangium aurantiacum]
MGLHTVTITGVGTTMTRTVTFTLAIHSPSCTNSGQQLSNSGFESGEANWTAPPGAIAQRGHAHTGAWNARLGKVGPEAETLSQTVVMPAGCPFVVLSFWLHVDSRESSSEEFDILSLDARVDGAYEPLGYWSNAAAGAGYWQVNIDASIFAGHTVTVSLTSWQDRSLASSFHIDDFELNAY